MTKKERREIREREKEFRRMQRKYVEPILKHECETTCNTVPASHLRAEIWDDFELSQRDREVIDMEVIRSRGRMDKEMTLLRQFVSTADGSFVLRLSSVTGLHQQRISDLHFDDRDECGEYYNYCIKTFGFTEVKPVNELDDVGFFEALDEFDGVGFLDDLDDEDEFVWDMDDEEDDDFPW